VTTLASLGDMRSAQSEHTVGLDGIAIIVSPSNRLTSLTVAQVKAIFTGEIRDWSDLGQPAGEIDLYARDEESGTRKMFEEMVLGRGAKMAPLAARKPEGYDDSDQLSDDVLSDPRGIGFVGMSYIKSAKALAIGDGKATALAPTTFTVRTENYPLTRRLFLYTAAQPKPDVTRFIEFALGPKGQATVRQTIVDLTPVLRPASEVDNRPCQLSPGWHGDRRELCQLRARANAIDASFRFLSGSFTLDNLASPNLVRVMQAMEKTPNARLVLAGFADSRGDYRMNCRLSKQRAEAVARGLATLGIINVETRGYCDELPVRDNIGEDFEKNRRVEVYEVDIHNGN
jgi:phosphate transport system substrate-binding protein